MQAIQEYNEVEVFYHGVSQFFFQQLLAEAGGSVENIRLHGCVFAEDTDFASASSGSLQWTSAAGEGYVFALDYFNREGCETYAGKDGSILLLGWDGEHYDDIVSLQGQEYLVPLASYKIIGVQDAE